MKPDLGDVHQWAAEFEVSHKAILNLGVEWLRGLPEDSRRTMLASLRKAKGGFRGDRNAGWKRRKETRSVPVVCLQQLDSRVSRQVRRASLVA